MSFGKLVRDQFPCLGQSHLSPEMLMNIPLLLLNIGGFENIRLSIVLFKSSCQRA